MLKRLSDLYPHLISPHVLAAIDNWENCLFASREQEQRAADLQQAEEEALSRLALELLQTQQMEDVMQQLSEEFSVPMDYQHLIDLVGREAYLEALDKEVEVLKENSISLEQTAQLWNGMGKPVPGGGHWSESAIRSLVRSN
ncbi:MAG: hypothetical protein QNJ78_08815 [Gammaproteobacteria bacterium]|nr:hypothetical protein [Gammaproteobacteria bacterium]